MSTFAEQLSNRFTSNDRFWHIYDTLQSAGARTTLPRRDEDDAAPTLVDIAKLLYCASVFVQTEDDHYKSMAQAIALNAILVSNDSTLRERCVHILTELGNFPGLSYIDSHYQVEHVSLLGQLNRRVSQELNTVKIGRERLALTDFQKEVWDSLPETGALAISAPTSAGKSFLVIEYLCRLASTRPHFLAVYVAPTRALLAEVYQKVKDRMAEETGVRISAVPSLDPEGATRQIFVLTQERLQVLLAVSEFKFDLIVVDEAQNISDGPRGILLQECLEQAIQRNNATRIIMLAPGAEGFEEIAAGIGLPGIEPAVSTVSPVIQNRILVSKVTGRNHLHLELLLRSRRVSLGNWPAKRGIDLPETFLASVALELGAEGGSLVYATGPENAETTANRIAQGLADRKDPKLEELSDFIQKHVHPSYVLAHHVKKGVAFHYGKMPTLLREALEGAFKDDDKLSFLTCTTTLFQGINLPARNVFIDTPTRGRGTKTMLDPAMLWNFAGRAGRMLGDIVGNVFLVNYDDWAEQPMDEFVRFRIRSALKTTLVDSMDEVIDAVRGQMPMGRLNENASRIRASAGLLIARAATGRLEALTTRLLDRPDNKSQVLIEAARQTLETLALPASILEDNWMIDPFGQRRLYDTIVEKIRADEFDTLIPIGPNEKAAGQVYGAIFNRIHKALTGANGNFGALVSGIALQWMRGEPYPAIIAKAIAKKERAHKSAVAKYEAYKEENPKSRVKRPGPVNMNTVIRQTFDLIEDQVRFTFVQFGKCYIDLLKLALEKEGRTEHTEYIFDFALALELGIATGSGRSFVELGLSRIAATVLEGMYPDTNLSVKEARDWLWGLDVDALQINGVIIDELLRLKLIKPREVSV